MMDRLIEIIVLLYMDDVLCISINAENVLKKNIGKYFLIKPGSDVHPNIYLGNKVLKVNLENGVESWSFSSSQKVQNAVLDVETYIKKLDTKLPKKDPAPFTSSCRT